MTLHRLASNCGLAEYIIGYAARAQLCFVFLHVIILVPHSHGRTLVHQKMAQCVDELVCAKKLNLCLHYTLLPEHVLHQFV